MSVGIYNGNVCWHYVCWSTMWTSVCDLQVYILMALEHVVLLSEGVSAEGLKSVSYPQMLCCVCPSPVIAETLSLLLNLCVGTCWGYHSTLIHWLLFWLWNSDLLQDMKFSGGKNTYLLASSAFCTGPSLLPSKPSMTRLSSVKF